MDQNIIGRSFRSKSAKPDQISDKKKPHRDIKLSEGEFESVGGFTIHLLGNT